MTNHPTPSAEELLRKTDNLGGLHARVISILLWGWRIGAGLLLLGVVIAFARHETLSRVAVMPSQVVSLIAAREAAGVVDLAILLLIATPVIATAVVAIGYWRRDDHRYAFVTLAVLGILLASVVTATR